MDHPPAVAEDDISGPEAIEKAGNSNACCSRAADGHGNLRKALFHQLEGIDQSGQGHHCRAVLIVVKDGDVEGFLEPLLNLEAAGSADVLQVDPPEDGLNSGYGVDNDRRVLGVDRNGKGIDSGKVLEEYCFSLHHR